MGIRLRHVARHSPSRSVRRGSSPLELKSCSYMILLNLPSRTWRAFSYRVRCLHCFAAPSSRPNRVVPRSVHSFAPVVRADPRIAECKGPHLRAQLDSYCHIHGDFSVTPSRYIRTPKQNQHFLFWNGTPCVKFVEDQHGVYPLPHSLSGCG